MVIRCPSCPKMSEKSPEFPTPTRRWWHGLHGRVTVSWGDFERCWNAWKTVAGLLAWHAWTYQNLSHIYCRPPISSLSPFYHLLSPFYPSNPSNPSNPSVQPIYSSIFLECTGSGRLLKLRIPLRVSPEGPCPKLVPSWVPSWSQVGPKLVPR